MELFYQKQILFGIETIHQMAGIVDVKFKSLLKQK